MPRPRCFLGHTRRKLKKVWSLRRHVSPLALSCQSVEVTSALCRWQMKMIPLPAAREASPRKGFFTTNSSFRFLLAATSPQRMCRKTSFSPYWALPVSIPAYRLEPSCLHFKLNLKIWAKYDGFVDSCLGKEVLQGIHYTTGWGLMPKYRKTHGFPEGAWQEICSEGAVQAAEAMAPWRDRYEMEITEARESHRKNRELGNIQPSWKRSGKERR